MFLKWLKMVLIPVCPFLLCSRKTKHPEKSRTDREPKAVPGSWKANKNHFRPISEQACALVEEAYAFYDIYDVIVRTKADTMDKLKEIHDRIRKLDRVKQTLTMITYEG